VTDLYRIETRYAVAGIVVSNGVVVKAAPIFRRFEGMLLSNVIRDVLAHHGKIQPVKENNMPTITMREELHNHVQKITEITSQLLTSNDPKVREQAGNIQYELLQITIDLDRKPEEEFLDQKVEQKQDKTVNQDKTANQKEQDHTRDQPTATRK
jgi:Tol biopolymer transport system component